MVPESKFREGIMTTTAQTQGLYIILVQAPGLGPGPGHWSFNSIISNTATVVSRIWEAGCPSLWEQDYSCGHNDDLVYVIMLFLLYFYTCHSFLWVFKSNLHYDYPAILNLKKNREGKPFFMYDAF